MQDRSATSSESSYSGGDSEEEDAKFAPKLSAVVEGEEEKLLR